MNKGLSKPYIYLIASVVLFFTWHFGRAVGAANVEPIYVPVLETITEYVDKPVEVEKLIYIPAETQAMEFVATAYCPCSSCCGMWSENRPGGIVYTASGAEAIEGVTVAVDTSLIPYGTMLYIEGVGMRIAQDCGGAIKGAKLDLFFDDHSTALDFGRQTLKVWILS